MTANLTTAADLPTISHYYPEMGETAPPAALIHARLSHYGRHYYLRVHPSVDRLAGRGVEFLGVDTEKTLVPGSKFVGWSSYKVTMRAMKAISAQYATTGETLL